MNIINLPVPAGVSSPVAECGAVMIGYVGEGGVTQVVLDFSAWREAYGDGVVTLGVQRSGDSSWYPVALSVDGTTAAWLVSKLDTSTEGMGVARFAYTVGGAEKRSAVWQFFVDRGLQSPEGDTPDPYESWVETLTELGAETLQNAKDAQEAAEAAEQSATDAAGSAESAETAKNAAGDAAAAAGESARAAGENASTAAGAAQAAQNAASAAEQSATDAAAAQQAAETAVTHYPKIVNDYWWVWDASTGAYVNTNVKAKGEDGEGAVSSVNGKTGAVTLDAEDVGALPDSSTLDDIPDGSTYKRPTAAQLRQIQTNAAAIAGKQAIINASGILKGSGNGQVSAAVAGTDYLAPGALAPYRTAAAQDVIDAAQDAAIAGKYTKPGTGIPENDLASDVQSKIDNALPKTGDGSNVTAAFTAAANRTNISTGEKLSVIFGKIAKWFSDLGSAAFRAATGSITQNSTDLVESGAVYNGLSGKYTKPAGGIPATDMAQAVQTSLDKADTALQEHQSLAAYRTAAAQDVIDEAQDREIRNLTSAINDPVTGLGTKAPVILETVSGAIASFDDGADNMPVKKLVVNIEPVQSGSGDPSPDNVRPISGWTQVTVSQSGADTSDPDETVYPFPSDAGTVYGGTLTINEDGTGELMVTHAIVSYDKNDTWAKYYGFYATNKVRVNSASQITNGICDYFKVRTSAAETVGFNPVSVQDGDNTYFVPRFYYDAVNTVQEWINYLAENNKTIQVAYLLDDPILYQLTAQQITTLFGQNNIWADCGDVEVTYRADTKLFVEKQGNVADVQVNGTSIVQGGVANIPMASASTPGVVISGAVTVSGTTPTITAMPGVRYVCGEVTTLDITLPSSGIVDVTFESGSVPTVLTITPPTGVTLKWANGFDPTSLDAGTTYEINIMDGFGVAAKWI